MAESETKAGKIHEILSTFVLQEAKISAGSKPAVSTSDERPPVQSKSPVKPRDKKALLDRIHSFDSLTWFAKPGFLSPVNCARYGWKNVDYDILQCVTCKAQLNGHLPSTSEPDVYQQCCDRVEKALKCGHHPYCGWTSNPCPKMYLDPCGDNPREAKTNYKSRLNSLLPCGDNLPKFEESTITSMEGLRQVLYKLESDILTSGKACDNEEARSAAVLALTGWQCRKSHTDLISCEWCKREVGLWNCKSLNPAHNPRDDSSDDEEEHLQPKRQKLCDTSQDTEVGESTQPTENISESVNSSQNESVSDSGTLDNVQQNNDNTSLMEAVDNTGTNVSEPEFISQFSDQSNLQAAGEFMDNILGDVSSGVSRCDSENENIFERKQLEAPLNVVADSQACDIFLPGGEDSQTNVIGAVQNSGLIFPDQTQGDDSLQNSFIQEDLMDPMEAQEVEIGSNKIESETTMQEVHVNTQNKEEEVDIESVENEDINMEIPQSDVGSRPSQDIGRDANTPEEAIPSSQNEEESHDVSVEFEESERDLNTEVTSPDTSGEVLQSEADSQNIEQNTSQEIESVGSSSDIGIQDTEMAGNEVHEQTESKQEHLSLYLSDDSVPEASSNPNESYERDSENSVYESGNSNLDESYDRDSDNSVYESGNSVYESENSSMVSENAESEASVQVIISSSEDEVETFRVGSPKNESDNAETSVVNGNNSFEAVEDKFKDSECSNSVHDLPPSSVGEREHESDDEIEVPIEPDIVLGTYAGEEPEVIPESKVPSIVDSSEEQKCEHIEESGAEKESGVIEESENIQHSDITTASEVDKFSEIGKDSKCVEVSENVQTLIESESNVQQSDIEKESETVQDFDDVQESKVIKDSEVSEQSAAEQKPVTESQAENNTESNDAQSSEVTQESEIEPAANRTSDAGDSATEQTPEKVVDDAQEMDTETTETAQNVGSEVPAPTPKRKFKMPKKKHFDPVSEHRSWCPWAAALETGKSGESGKAGWERLVEILTPETSELNDSIPGASPSERLRKLRRLFKNWTSPKANLES